MRNVSIASRFKKDFKLVQKSPRFKKWSGKFEAYVEMLRKGESLPPESRDKPMASNSEYRGCRDFHAAPDIVVLYRMTDETVELLRIGQHNNLGLTEDLVYVNAISF